MHVDRTNDRFELLLSDTAVPQNSRAILGHQHDGRLNADAARSAVEN